MAIQIVYIDPGSPGYYPVSYMVRLAAELLDAELVVLRSRPFTLVEKANKFRALLSRRRGELDCIMICTQPADLAWVFLLENWRTRYRRLIAWVFDSFWSDHIPPFARRSGIFDHVFITEQEDLETWRSAVRVPVDWLPWGSDALRLGSGKPVRPVDLLRFGRQPVQWEDDTASASLCESMQLRFQGRPPFFSDACEGERALMKMLGEAKFTLSFSNRVNPALQTHPTREYLTGRWTDALSAGATVAGIPPKSDSVRALLWEGALLDLTTVDRAKGLAVLAAAVRDWTPHRARRNYLRSLETLDWRWRLAKLASALEAHPPTLDAEMKRLRQAIDCARQADEK
jgi:hypothetical protein